MGEHAFPTVSEEPVLTAMQKVARRAPGSPKGPAASSGMSDQQAAQEGHQRSAQQVSLNPCLGALQAQLSSVKLSLPAGTAGVCRQSKAHPYLL